MITVQRTITKLPLLLRVVALYVLVGVPLWWSGQQLQPQTRHAPVVIAATPTSAKETPTAEVPAVISGLPTTLRIPRVGIGLSVRDGVYDPINKTWSLSDDAAFFATMTAHPNDRTGNTLIYGHNTVQVLEPVKDLAEGDIAQVVTSNGYMFSYVYRDDQMVDPTNTTIVTAEMEKPQLTLLTCEGVWSEQRRLLFFDFKEVVKI